MSTTGDMPASMHTQRTASDDRKVGLPMSDPVSSEVGTIGWVDLTVDEAAELRDFYAAVTQWQPRPVSMGSYEDFNMVAPRSGAPCAGICHARGVNAEIPPVWLIYIAVEDLTASAKICQELGGEILLAPRSVGTIGRYCVIRDPAGAVAALMEHSR